MPRPLKFDRPTSNESNVEPIQGSTIVILHPGSSTLQLGKATDHFPHSIPHCIARRIIDGSEVPIKEDYPLIRDGIWHPESETTRELALQEASQVVQSARISFGVRKSHTSVTQVIRYNQNVEPQVIEGGSGVSWTDVHDSPSVVIGEQAQYLDPSSPYTTHWPIRHGHLNIHNGPGGSLASVCTDLEDLWSLAIQTYLDIPLKDLKFYRAVLLVPDIFEKQHVKEMVDLILTKMGFSSIIIHQESVCATFGSGLSSACVVDVGDQKISISCVEDGISLPPTRLRLNFGGSDITRCFFWLLQRINFPYKECDMNDKLDAYLLQELKETFCHLSMEIPSGQVHEFHVYRPDENGISYYLKLGDEPLQAPSALFLPRLFGIVDQKLIVTSQDMTEHDPEDLLDDRAISEIPLREGLSKKGKLEGDGLGETGEKNESFSQSNLSSVDNSRGHFKLKQCEFQGLGIDQAILHSIDSCVNPETKRKMYGTVLLVGGGLMFKSADRFLLHRLQVLLPQQYQFLRNQIEVVTKPKDMDPRTVCWKGGSVLSILDSAQELWISREEWKQYGPRVLRERCPFQWSSNWDKA